MRRPVLAVAVVATVALGLPFAHAASSTRVGRTAISPDAALKPVQSGLANMAGLPTASFQRVVNSAVVAANWADLQTTPNGEITANNAIDAAIARVRSANAADPSLRLSLKVRLLAGVHSPDWVKSIGGTPPYVSSGNTGKGGTVPRFWTDQVGAAYHDLHAKLAAKYDGIPEVREITVSRCTTVGNESMLRQTSNPASVRNLLAAGYTATADDRCQHEQIDDAKLWQHTRVSEVFSSYQRINPDGTVGTDVAYAQSIMDYCRQELGKQCVLQKNRFGQTAGATTAADPAYDHIKQLGAPITLQLPWPGTGGSTTLAGLLTTLRVAVSDGVTAVELSPTSFGVTSDDLAPYATGLAANDDTSTPPPPPPPTKSDLKQPIHGAMSMGGPAPSNYLPVVNAAVVRVTWAELQPTKNGPIVDNNKIDKTIAKVRAWNAATPGLNMGLKLRFDSGVSAPEWVKNLGGAPIVDRGPSVSGTVPRFWTSAVQLAYADAYSKLAAKYDDAPEIREVTNSLCSTQMNEPTVRWDNEAQPFYANGFTLAADLACQRQSFEYGLLWRHTTIDTAINAYHVLNPTGVSTSLDLGMAIADQCRQILGPQCLLENNELGKLRGSQAQYDIYTGLYNHFKDLGAPISFQMAQPSRSSADTQQGFLDTLQGGIEAGANSIELFPTYTSIPVAALAPYDSKLASQ